MFKLGVVSLFVALGLVACSSSDDDNPSTAAGSQVECSSPTQCTTGLCLTLKQNEQNKAGTCTMQCTDDAGCSGGRCVSVPTATTGVNRICLPSCTVDSDCTNGFVCVPSAEGNVCLVRAANSTSSCSDDSQCTEAKAQCITGASGAMACSRALDAPDVFMRECTLETAGDCPGLTCVTFKANKQNLSGTCTMSCVDDTDCPGGACVGEGAQKLCLVTCTTDTDCLNGFACVPESAASDRKVCGVTAN